MQNNDYPDVVGQIDETHYFARALQGDPELDIICDLYKDALHIHINAIYKKEMDDLREWWIKYSTDLVIDKMIKNITDIKERIQNQ